MRVLVLLLAATLAGCTGEPEPIDPGPQGPEPTVPDGPATPGAPDNESVEPPTAQLTADVDNGTAPLNVTFTLSGTGTNLTWTLDADGDGTADGEGTQLPTQFLFSFAEAGDYTALLSVASGNLTAHANATIAVAEAVPDELPFEPVVMTQDVTLSCPHCFGSDVTETSTCLGVAAGENGLDCAWFELDASWAGKTWAVSGSLLPVVEFHPDCTGQDRVAVSVDPTGTIPDGVGCLIVFDPVDPVVTMRLEVS